MGVDSEVGKSRIDRIDEVGEVFFDVCADGLQQLRQPFALQSEIVDDSLEAFLAFFG